MFGRLYLANIRALMRDPGTLIATFLLPIGYAVLFGLGTRFQEAAPEIAVSVQSGAPAASAIAEELERSSEFKVTRIPATEDLRSVFDKTKLAGILLIPDVSEGKDVTLVFDERSAERLVNTQAKLRSFLERYNLELAGVKDQIGMAVTGVRGPRRSTYDYVMPSVIMFSVIVTALSLGASRVVKAREQGILKRLMVTPLKARTYMASDIATRATVASVQTSLVLVVGAVGYGLRLTPYLLWLIPLAVMGMLIFICLGFFVAAAFDNAEAANGITTIAGFVMVFLSGGLPLTLFPPSVTRALSFLPVRPMIESDKERNPR